MEQLTILMDYTICYSSKAAPEMTDEVLEQIFQTTQKNNRKKGIHGILLYGMDNFFQVLEGDKNVLLPLYEDVISNDPRHIELFEIINKPSSMSVFSSYDSKFNIVKTVEELENIKSYLRQHQVNSTAGKIHRLLNPFLL